MTSKALISPALVIAAAVVASAAYSPLHPRAIHVGRQPDGTFIVSSGQRIEPGSIAFDGRPIDIALDPTGRFLAVLNQRSVFLADRTGVLPGSNVALADAASYRGALWTPDGRHLFVSTAGGYVQSLTRDGAALALGPRIEIRPIGASGNPVPGGMAATRDGSRLFVAAASRNAVEEIDLTTDRWIKDWPVGNIPFEVRLSSDEATLIVSNWAGRHGEKDDDTAPSGGVMVAVDPRGAASTGTVSLIDRKAGRTRSVTVGLHPSGIAVEGERAYVANAASDSISVLDVPRGRVVRTIPIRWGRRSLFGSMPSALATNGRTLYACDGGDDALCEIDTANGSVRGFRPAGYFPTGVALSPDGRTAYVVNTKGNGSVRETVKGKPGNTHEFQGTLSVIDLGADLRTATAQVAGLNGWDRRRPSMRPNLAVYRGAIGHVLYIIKENRTYDEILGDMPEGNGDLKLCDLGEGITPNHHALAREFTLFDNAYTCGTNSADGHQWADEALANDYIERFYAEYTRSYPYDGTDPMAISAGGCIWDAAIRKGKTFRDYGEFCADRLARITPAPGSWLDTWRDRAEGAHRYQVRAATEVAGLTKYIHPEVICWPLLESDQWRADRFIEEYRRFSREGRVPNLMVLTLPCDHTEGDDPRYPKPRSMIADNDLALGRVVEAVSHSAEWKSTCIFVIEDDSQAGADHVDGHRTVCFAISPYTRRRFVDSTMYTQVSILRSIELMLGLDPMNRFDALAAPFAACFTDRPDVTPYDAKPNRVPLDEMNPKATALRGPERFWAEKSLALDWSGLDRPDPYWLNRVIWHSVRGADEPYPADRHGVAR